MLFFDLFDLLRSPARYLHILRCLCLGYLAVTIVLIEARGDAREEHQRECEDKACADDAHFLEHE